MTRLNLHKSAAALLFTLLLLANTSAAQAQNTLPDDAKQILRQAMLQLQMLEAQSTANGQTAAARAIHDQIQQMQTSSGLTPLPLPPVQMTNYRSRVGETFRVRVSASRPNTSLGIWGDGIYTDDSDISAAVVHAGLLAAGQDGEVVVTFLPGQNQYSGASRNGFTSSSWGSYQGSYRLAKVDVTTAALPMLPPPPPSAPLPTVGSVLNTLLTTNFPTNSFNALDDQSLWQMLGGQTIGTRANSVANIGALKNRINESFEFEVTGASSGAIWGDGIYTDDSELSVTAVHAGVLAPGEKGRVRITILPGLQQYSGTLKNGVSSQNWGSWTGSYRFEGGGKTAATAAAASASIGGRISLPAGQPHPNAYIVALKIGFRDGQQSTSEVASTRTDTNGEYRFAALPPGNYLIAAVSSQGSYLDNLSLWYFPGVSGTGAALQVPVHSKQQVVGIDFTAGSTKTFKVSGKVANPPAAGVVKLSVVQRDSSKPIPDAAMLIPNGILGPVQGEFELMLPAGSWDVFAVAANAATAPATVPPAGIPAYLTGRTSVKVTDRNVDAGSITLGSADIPGRVVIEPTVKLPDGFSLSQVEIRLAAVDGTPAPLWQHAASVRANAEGRFTFSAVPEGEYAIQISPAIPNAYLADMRSGSTSILDRGTLRVKPGSTDPVEAIFRAGGGTIQGSVQIPAGRSVTAGRVVLIPASARRGNAMLYKKESFATAEPRFRFSNVPPGQYRIFAFESLPAGGAEMNADFMSKLEGSGETITVGESGSAGVAVRMIEAEN